jgi:hypothetical protein
MQFKLNSRFASLIHLGLFTAVAAILTGCMAMPIKKFAPNIAAPELFCDPNPAIKNNPALLLTLLPEELPRLPGEPWDKFHYVAPDPTNDKNILFPSSTKDYYSDVSASLPRDLQNDKVAIALSKFLTAQSAKAQLNAQVADQKRVQEQYSKELFLGLDQARILSETKVIQAYSSLPRLTHGDLKKFANTLLGEARLKPGTPSLIATPPSRLAVYFTALYKGSFYDRMGNVATKPEIGLTVSDAEIEGAETVFLEYIIDLLDKTPVLVATSGSGGGTLYYPGNPSNEPTAHHYDPQNAVQIPPASPDACGITQQNVWLLRDIASGSSNEAATVGGLVTNTWGGFSFGVPVLNLKLSIGDNDTLSSIVKAAASEAALRASLAAGYWSLRHLKLNISDPSN